MQIQELKQNKAELEKYLRKIISEEVMKFQQNNPVSIYNISIRTTEVTEMQGKTRTLVLGVDVDIRIRNNLRQILFLIWISYRDFILNFL